MTDLREIWRFLEENVAEMAAGAGAEDLARYAVPPENSSLMERLVWALADYKPQYAPPIGRWWEQLYPVLEDCDAARLCARYPDPADGPALYAALGDIGKTRQDGSPAKQACWRKLTDGIVSGAHMLQNGGAEQIRALAAEDPQDADALRALFPRITAVYAPVRGMGFTLACNYLKDCGCVYLSKPDERVTAFHALLTGQKAAPEDIVCDMFTWAREIGVTPYRLDRWVYLLYSGNYFDDDRRCPGRGEAFKAWYTAQDKEGT